MEGFKGTEGKWTVVDGSAAGKQVVSDEAPKIRRNVASCGGPRREQNANLIAAAPELLELVLSANGSNGCHTVMWQDKAKSVLEKVLGQ